MSSPQHDLGSESAELYRVVNDHSDNSSLPWKVVGPDGVEGPCWTRQEAEFVAASLTDLYTSRCFDTVRLVEGKEGK